MDDFVLLGQLEELAHVLGIQLRYEKMEEERTFYGGGLCRVRGEHLLIVNSKATTKDKIQTLVKAVKRFDLDNIYLRPAIREYLEIAQE